MIENKSDVTSKAQYTKLCVDQDITGDWLTRKIRWLKTECQHSPVVKTMALIQLESGIRVSELLRIKHSDIITENLIRIRASKRSLDRVVNVSDFFGYLKDCKLSKCDPFSVFDRFFVYRQYKQLGIVFVNSYGKHNSVTHAPRHALAKAINDKTKSRELTSDFLRHVSKSSVDSYI